jgi:hypothetical protein
MKTLEQFGLAGYKTGNYSDYCNSRDGSIVCCGLMDIHEDSNNLGEFKDSIFKVEPLYWDEDVVFVYKPRSRWHSLTKEGFLNKKRVSGIGITYSGNAFYFNAKKYHGLVPKSIANNLNNKDYLMSEEYLTFKKSCMEKITPKLVWKWQ